MNTTNITDLAVITNNIIPQYLVLTSSIISNFILLLFLFTRDGAFSFVDKLMINSVVCNLALVLLAIPTSLRIDASTTYPFSDIGCKLINPLSTCFVNSTVFVYVVVAWERWLVLSRFRYVTTPTQVCVTISCLNVLAFVVVVPYVNTSYIHLDDNGVTYCSERWSSKWRKVYTLVLFVVQYGAPVPLMTVLYAKTWFLIYRMNKNVAARKISGLEDIVVATSFELKGDNGTLSSCRTTHCSTIDDNSDADSEKRKTSSYTLPYTHSYSKNKFSPVQMMDNGHRDQQTREILIRFSAIMVVFAVFQLPNHILWIMVDFLPEGEAFFRYPIHDICYFMTYANCVLNPIIYGQYNRRFCQNLIRTYKHMKLRIKRW